MTVEHEEYSTFIFIDKELKKKWNHMDEEILDISAGLLAHEIQKTQLDITIKMMAEAIIQLQNKVEELEKNIKKK